MLLFEAWEDEAMTKKRKIAEECVGRRGTPGDQFCLIKGTVYERSSGRLFEVEVYAHSGSNQGYLEAHDDETLMGRGNTPVEAIDAIRDDVEALDEWLTLPERRQLLRSLEYAAEDALETS